MNIVSSESMREVIGGLSIVKKPVVALRVMASERGFPKISTHLRKS
jgi:hypothetical protein